MTEEIESRLIEFVRSTSAVDVAIRFDTDLLTTNVLDSLMLMELVIVIENEWSVILQGDDIAPQNFRSLRSLATLIDSRRRLDNGMETVAA